MIPLVVGDCEIRLFGFMGGVLLVKASKILSYVFGSVKNPVHVLKVNSTEASLTWEDSKPEHVHRYKTPTAP